MKQEHEIPSWMKLNEHDVLVHTGHWGQWLSAFQAFTFTLLSSRKCWTERGWVLSWCTCTEDAHSAVCVAISTSNLVVQGLDQRLRWCRRLNFTFPAVGTASVRQVTRFVLFVDSNIWKREFCAESHLISTRISLFCDSHQDSRKSCSFPASVLIFECCAN